MRKIEEDMLYAISHFKNWSCNNTEVEVLTSPNIINVYLYDNLIGSIHRGEIKLSSCGWYTKTTKSRLNALLSRGIHFIGGSNVNKEWYLKSTWSESGKPFFDGIETDFVMY